MCWPARIPAVLPSEVMFYIGKSDIEASKPGSGRCPIERAILKTFPYLDVHSVTCADRGIYVSTVSKWHSAWMKLQHTAESDAFWRGFEAGRPVKPTQMILQAVAYRSK